MHTTCHHPELGIACNMMPRPQKASCMPFPVPLSPQNSVGLVLEPRVNGIRYCVCSLVCEVTVFS